MCSLYSQSEKQGYLPNLFLAALSSMTKEPRRSALQGVAVSIIAMEVRDISQAVYLSFIGNKFLEKQLVACRVFIEQILVRHIVQYIWPSWYDVNFWRTEQQM